MKTTLRHIETYRTCNMQNITGGSLQAPIFWVDSKRLMTEVV